MGKLSSLSTRLVTCLNNIKFLFYNVTLLSDTVTKDKTEDTLSDYEEDPLVVRSSEDVEVEDEYYEDDLGASHGDQEPYSDSEDVTKGSDSEKTSPTSPQS